MRKSSNAAIGERLLTDLETLITFSMGFYQLASFTWMTNCSFSLMFGPYFDGGFGFQFTARRVLRSPGNLRADRLGASR